MLLIRLAQRPAHTKGERSTRPTRPSSRRLSHSRRAPFVMLRAALRPAARALSSWAPASGDRVLLRGLLFHAHHGVLPA